MYYHYTMLNWGWKPKDWQQLNIRERGIVIAGIDIEQENLAKQQAEMEAKSK